MKKILYIIQIFISVFVCLFCFTCENKGYSLIFLLPLVNAVCSAIFYKPFFQLFQKKNFIALFLYCLILIKYTIMPFFIVLNQDYLGGVLTGQVPADSSVKSAIILLAFEQLTLYITVFLFSRIKRKEINQKKELSQIKLNIVFLAFFAISIFLILIYKDAFFPSQFLIIDSDYTKTAIEGEGTGIIKIIFSLFKILVCLFCLQFFSEKYKVKKQRVFILGSFIIFLVYLILSTSMSRWNLLFPTIAILYILKDLYGKTINKYIIAIACLLVVMFASISIVKFNWLLDSDSSHFEIFKIYTMQLQEYFSGPRAVAQGLETIEIYDREITYKTLANDYLGSVPGIADLFDQKNRINIYYNYHIKGTSARATQIMPMSTIGVAYFTPALFYTLSCIHIYFALYFGYVANYKKNIFEKYFYVLFGLWFAMCIGFNTQIIFGNFMNLFFPFSLILFVYKKFFVEVK